MFKLPKKRNLSGSSSASGLDSDVEQKDHFEIAVMGAASVGKTCIVNRFLFETFQADHKATIEDAYQGNFSTKETSLTLDILDTTGSFEFPAMRRLSIDKRDAFILVYSIDNEESFSEVERIRQEILDQKVDILTPIIVVGNKCDLEKDRQISKETAETIVCIDWDHSYIETSAKEDVNIVEIFEELLRHANMDHVISAGLCRHKKKLRHYSVEKKTLSSSKHKIHRSQSCIVS